jgi:tetratricopeptide (TPR) repeat protein
LGSFYEIIRNLKIPDKKKFKKKSFKIKPRILILTFLFLVNLSGLALVIFSYYMKYYIKSSAIPPPQVKITPEESLKPPIPPPPPPPQVKETVSISKPVSQKIIAKSISIPKKRLTKPPPSFKNILAKNISKPKASQTPVISRPVDKKEPPAEGSFLTKESLLNNLLLIAEEERKKGNCQKAIFYYKSYLEERENPSIMNNLGACLIELGEFDSAINIFNKALSLKNDPEIKYNLIIAYFKKGDVERACFELKKLDTNTSLDERMKRLKELCK